MPYQDTPPQRSRPTFLPGTDPRLRRPNAAGPTPTATMPWATPAPPRQLPSNTFVGPPTPRAPHVPRPGPGLLPPSTAPPPSPFDAEQAIREANRRGSMSPMNPGNPYTREPLVPYFPDAPKPPGGPQLPGGPNPPYMKGLRKEETRDIRLPRYNLTTPPGTSPY